MADSTCRRCGRPVLPIAEICPHCHIDHPCDPFLNRTVRGNIRIESVIGSGGMGTVYKGFEAHLQRPVAVKVLNTMSGTNQRSVSYFMQEARVLSKLRHPNLVSVIDFGQESDGTLLMVMEYIPGRSLESLIERERELAFDRVVRIMIQVLSALEEVHRHQIVHRDLKPGNIVLEDVAGAQDFVKVLDFGIAKILQTNTFTSIDGGLTAAGTAVGTPQYMSPEQAQGLELDGRSDIYSGGILMFEMLTGKLPFDSDNIVSMLVRRMAEDPPAPSSLRSEVPPSLDAICLRALARESGERFPDAAAFREALQGVLHQLSDQSGQGTSSPPGPTSRSSGTHSGQVDREVMILAVDLDGSMHPQEELETFIYRFAEASGGFYKAPLQGSVVVVIFEHQEVSAGWLHATEVAVQMRLAAQHRFGASELKMGLSHGSVYGHSGSDPLEPDEIPIGPAIAMSMEQARRARAGQLLIPAEAADFLGERFELHNASSGELEVGAPRPRGSRPNPVEPTLSALPLVEVDEEGFQVLERSTATRRLDHAIKRVVKEGSGVPLMLIGPHGAGKSHLVTYARRLALRTGLRVLEVSAPSEMTDRPFRPVFDLFIQYLLPISASDGPRRHHPEDLRKALLDLGLGAIEARLFVDQYVAGTLDDPWTALNGGGVEPLPYAQICRALHVFTPRERRQILTSVFRMILKRITAQQGLLVIVEDLDAADPGTVSCLASLAGSSLEMPMVMLATSTRDDVEELGVFSALHLPALEPEALEAFWSQLVPRYKGITPPREILAASGGIPMYLTSWIQSPLDDVEPPRGVLALMVEQLARLPGRVRRMLLIASIMGQFFEPAVLEGLFPRSSSLMDTLQESNVLGLLEIYPPDPRWWRFRNPLIHQAVYRSVSRADRSRYHKNIFSSLSELDEPLSQRQLLLEAVQASKSVRGMEAARRTEVLGDRFSIAGDLDGAMDWYLLSLEFMVEARDAGAWVDLERLGDLGLKSMEIAVRLRRDAQVKHITELFEAVNTDQRIRLAILSARQLLNNNEHMAALRLIEDALDEHRSSSPLLAGLMVLQAQIISRASQLTQARQLLRKVLRILERNHERLPEDFTHYPWLVALLYGEMSLSDGDEEEAEKFLEIGFQRARVVDDVNGVLKALQLLASLLLSHGEPKRLAMLCYEVLQASSLTLRPTHHVVIHQLLGRAYRASGDENRAKSSFQEAWEIARELGWSSAAKQNLQLLSEEPSAR